MGASLLALAKSIYYWYNVLRFKLFRYYYQDSSELSKLMWIQTEVDKSFRGMLYLTIIPRARMGSEFNSQLVGQKYREDKNFS